MNIQIGRGSQVLERTGNQTDRNRAVIEVTREGIAIGRAAHQRCRSGESGGADSGAADRDFVAVDRSGVHAIADVVKRDVNVPL